ncbi:MAG: PatB family C-S lyase [Boseongicola sp.]|nr:PatB family C-S lyase [Boseongicola sp.]
MAHDFDTQLVLRGSHAAKYDNLEQAFGVDDPEIIPMWVADMDFPAAPAIRAALQAEVDLGYCGYFGNAGAAGRAVAAWYGSRHGWDDIDPDWVRYTHGVVSGFGDVLATFSEPGDSIVVFSPVYHAFYRQVRNMGREILESRLKVENGRFHMDLDALQSSMTGRERIVTFCTPHNPGGRLWDVEEIRALARFCEANDLILISDEIHMDLAFPGARFVPTAVAAPEQLDRLVVLTAASKGFNIAGGETGLLVAPDPDMRARVDKVLADRESSPNRFGMAMLTAAFAHSGDWSEAARAYIAENFRTFAQRVASIPGVGVMEMDSTYLAWVDFSALGMSDEELLKRLLDAKVAPSPGTQFGTGGSGHMRFNLALPRPALLSAIDRIERAFADLQ